jgi:ATPase complex subunit ATP10
LRKDGDGPDGGRDLVEVLRGRVSVVAVQSGYWAEEQVQSFLGEKDGQNPKLRGLVEGGGGLVQRVDVNVQGDWTRQVLLRLFRGRLRRALPESQWGRYFMVKLARDVGKGLSEHVRDAMGLLNSQVGYVYLVDTECRIRWAGSGNAWKGEVDWLNMGIKRLLDEAREARRGECRSKSRASMLGESRPPQEIGLKRHVQQAVAA